MPDVLLIAVGLICLFVGGNWLVKSAARLAASFGVSAMVVALTVVAFGTSSPELLVSVNAARQGASELALGNVVGSNIANIGLILGLAAFITPLLVEWQFLKREIPLLIIVSAGAFIMALDGQISTRDGGILVVGFIIFTVLSYWLAWRDRQNIEPEISEFNQLEGITPKVEVRRGRELMRLLLGIVLLALGAQWTVEGATAIARALGVSDLLIGLTIVAFGTSLPELASALVAAWRKEVDIIVGSIVGSNIANVLIILGATALVQPIAVGEVVLRLQLPVMLGFTLALLVFLFDRTIQRREGILFVVAYVAFVIYSFVS